MSQGNGNAAIEQYKMIVSALPDDSQGYTQLAQAYNQLGRHERAIEAYEQALSLTPNSPHIYANLGQSY